MVMRFLGLFIPDSPLASETLIQTNGANDVLPISCVRARARAPAVHVPDVSMRWICLPPFGAEPRD